MPTKMDALSKKWSFREKSNQFFAFVYVFLIRQDHFVDNYLNINLKTGMLLKYAFCLPYHNYYVFSLIIMISIVNFLFGVYISQLIRYSRMLFFVIIIAIATGLLLTSQLQETFNWLCKIYNYTPLWYLLPLSKDWTVYLDTCWPQCLLPYNVSYTLEIEILISSKYQFS
jgi:hypothetical protein